MKFVLMLSLLILAQTTFAADRVPFCTHYYKHDIFSRDLVLSVLPDAAGKPVLWMDQPTPYGIRPYTYDISKLSCTAEGSLHIEAQSAWNTQKVVFNSKDAAQAGKLEYFNDKGEVSMELVMVCSPDKIKELCQ